MAAIAVKERPIIMQAHSVLAILSGVKTQTRQAVGHLKLNGRGSVGEITRMWPLPLDSMGFGCQYVAGVPPVADVVAQSPIACPYGRTGDQLWVKEAWLPKSCAGAHNEDDGAITIDYPADGASVYVSDYGNRMPDDWCIPDAAKRGPLNPLFMPRWASRLTLEITDIRVQRVQDISPADVWTEGLPRGIYRHAIKGFHPCDDGDEAMLPDGRVYPAVAAFGQAWDDINCVRSGGKFSWEANPWVWALTFKLVPASA